MSILQTIIAGLTGATVMTLLMTALRKTGWERADMIRALGSITTRTYENSLVPGLLIHSMAGIVLAFPYVLVLGGLDVTSIAGRISVGALIGFIHGFAMSFILVATVAEKHPLPQFQEAGFDVAAAHVLGHIAYGAGVATIAALLAIDLGFRF